MSILFAAGGMFLFAGVLGLAAWQRGPIIARITCALFAAVFALNGVALLVLGRL